MPVIAKSSPPKKPIVPINGAVKGSILSEAIPVSQLADDYIKMVIYGGNRTGKSTVACQFPKPALLVSFEPNKTGGARSVTKVDGVEYLRITATGDNPRAPYGTKKAMMLCQELRGHNAFKTVIVDSATSLQDIILQELLGLDSIPEMLSWGQVSQDIYRQRSEKTREALRPFLNLDCHVVVTAKERDHNPPKEERNKIIRGPQSESFFAADLGGATVGWLHDACDYIGRLYIERETKVVTNKIKLGNEVKETSEEVETGRVVRRLRTMLHPNYAAGIRSADPQLVPEYITGETPQQLYSDLMAVIQGKKVASGKYVS